MLETIENIERIGRSQAATSLALAAISVESAEGVLERHIFYTREALARQAQLVHAMLHGETTDLQQLQHHLGQGFQRALDLSQDCMEIAWTAQERVGRLLREQYHAVGAIAETVTPSPEAAPQTATVPARARRKA
jgi:hypothetical protein